ncbi:MAG: AAA family ATPase [Saprospiraceae bacterium]
MDKINYPLLCYPIKDKGVLGILVGTDFKVIQKDTETVKQILTSYLQRQYKKYDDYPYMDLSSAKLKVIEVSVRPTIRSKSGTFPLSRAVKVPMPAIYGETEQGYFECFLPLFEERFAYYDPKQFDTLVRHAATSLLNQASPDKIFRMLAYEAPFLEMVTIRVNFDREFDWNSFSYQRQYQVLNRLAEKFPYSKNRRQNISALPEAAWELEDKVNEVLDKLLYNRANVLLVGHPSVGKSAVLTQAIKKITNQSRQQQIQLSFWQIMSQRITASTKYLGEWQEVCELLIEELQASNGILWVVDIIQLLSSGGEGPEDSVAAFLLPFLQENKLQIIGEATPRELESMRRLLPGFVQTFQIIRIEELPEDKVYKVLGALAQYSSKRHKIDIQPEAINLAYRLLHRYFPYESFPGKGIKFLGQCISEAKLSHKSKVDHWKVIHHFVQQTGMPELFLRDDLLLDTKELTGFFQSNIIGQPEAIAQMCNLVKIFKAGLNNPNKPIATLLFAGPTGVGKTACAKTLANYFFGKGQKQSPLIRIDMSEYQHPGQITRFIGSGRGTGELIKDIRERPFSVLLLDEIEKADPSIFDALLSVLDEGILVDAYGRTTNFRNTIIIMTSNLGANNKRSISFKNTMNDESNYLSAIEKHFRPEFVNRIDGTVMFHSLTEEDVRQITIKELVELKQREGFVKKRLAIHFTEKVVDYLVSIGFDERYGARPLQRAIEQHLVSPIAQWLLEHNHLSNNILVIDYQQEITIKVVK